MAAIRDSKIHLGVDPLGGAGVHYWGRIAEQYRLDLTVVSDVVDPTFGFMTMDWDGKIRMDPSSPYAMARLVDLKDQFDVAFACDTDHDRHGIVTQQRRPDAAERLPRGRDRLPVPQPARNGAQSAAIGKTVVSSRMIDLVAQRLQRKMIEVPVGFKWFAAGLADGSLGFGGEESAGAAFLRRDGTSWTTDKDGLTLALLAAEITAKTGSDPGALYEKMTQELGKPVSDRVEAPADAQQKKRLAALAPDAITTKEIAGEPITEVIAKAPGNGAPIGGIRVSSKSGWFAARPSGTEEIYKIYAESFDGEAHLKRLLDEAQALVDKAIAG